MKTLLSKSLATLSLLVMAVSPEQANAAILYWDDNGATAGAGATPTDTWGIGVAKWSTLADGTSASVVWTPSSDAVFSAGTDAAGTYTVTTAAAIAANSITVEEGKVSTVTTAGAVTVGAGGVTVLTNATYSISSTLGLLPSGSPTITLNGGALENRTTPGGSTFVNVGFTLAMGVGGGTLNCPAGAASRFNLPQIITGPGSFTLSGAGCALGINGASTYGGSTTINSPMELRLFTAGTTIPATTDVTINGTGAFNLNRFPQTISSLSGSGFVSVGGTVLTINGTTNTTYGGVIQNSFTTYGALSSTLGKLTHSGSGTLTLTGVNTFDGQLTNLSGGITVNPGGRLCGAACDVVVEGGTINLNHVAQTVLSLAGTGGSVGLGSGHTLTVNNAATKTYSGTITNAGALTKTGAGIFILGGANTYAGNTTISAGTIRYGVANALPYGAGKGNVSVTGTLDLNGFNGKINGLSGNGTVTKSLAGTHTLTVGDNDQTSSFSGVIQNPTGTLALSKDGSGNLTLSGANTYSGTTTVSAGILTAGAANTLSANSPINVSGGTLDIGANNQSVPAVTLTSGSIASSSGTLTGSSYAVESGSVSAPLAGASAALTKTTAGTVTLSGANTYFGTTTVSAGTLTAGAVNTLSANSPINVSGGTLDIGANDQSVPAVTLTSGSIAGSSGTLSGASYDVQSGSVSAKLGGSAGLTKTTAGTVVLSGDNGYSGATVVSGGTLQVNGSLSGTSGVTVNAGGKLAGSGQINGVTVVSGAIAAGASPGTLNVNQLTLNGGGTNVFEINDTTGAEGTDPGWDLINVTNGVDVTATPVSKFVIDITSLTLANVAGDTANFDNTGNYLWKIMKSSAGFTNFDAAAFDLQTVNFSNALGNGAFLIFTNETTNLVLEFGQKPSISVQPISQSKNPNDSVTFSVTATGTGPTNYQWRYEGSPIFGATDSAYTIATIAGTDAGDYDVVITNLFGSLTSSVATLSVSPHITVQPVSQTKTVNESVTFSVTASGTMPLNYQWQKDGVDISGATDSDYTIGSVVTADAANTPGYTVAVGNTVLTNLSSAATLTVNKADQTISFDPITDKTYGDAPFALSATASPSGLTVSFSIVSGPASVLGNTLTITGVGAVSVRASQSGNVDYNAAVDVTNSFNIVKATLDVTAEDKTKAYGDAVPALTHVYSGFVYGEDETVLTGSPNLSTTATSTSVVPGSPYPITVTLGTLAAANYQFNLVNGNLTVTKVALTVTANNTNRNYGAVDPTFTASYSGFVLGENETVLTGSPSLTTTATASSPVAGSPYSITAALGTLAADNYDFASFVDGALTITKTPLIATADDKTKTYGASNPTLTVSYTGFVNGEDDTALTGSADISTTATGSSTVASSPHGITILLGTLAADNYALTNFVNGQLTITPATITATAEDKTKSYGSANPALTHLYSGFVLGEDETVITGTPSLNTTATVTSDVPGSPYPITVDVSGLSAANYQFSGVNGNLTVTKVALTVTANNTNRNYGAADPTFTASYSGFVLGENETVISGVPDFTTTATPTSTVLGSPYLITPALGTLTADNYNFTTFVDGALTITKTPLMVTADNQTKTYGAANPTLTISYAGFVNGEDDTVLTGSADISTTATVSSSVAGSPYPITILIGTLASDNYALTNFVNGQLTITPATLTVTADDKTKTYGDANPLLTHSYSGFVLGEDSSVLTGSPSLSTTATVSSSVAGSPYPITVTVGTLSAANYQFSFVNGALAVTRAALTVAADNKTRAYGAANPALTHGYSGFVLGEDSSVLTGSPSLSTIATPASTVAGSPYSITITQGTLVEENYQYTFVDGQLTVTAAALTINSDNTNRLYGAANPAFTGSIVGIQNGDNITATYSTPATVGSTVAGSPYPINQTLVDPDGKLPNYTITTNNGGLTINPAALTINVDDKCRATNAANPVFTGNIVGIQNSDDITATYVTTAILSSPSASYPITPNLADPDTRLPNYVVTTNAGTLKVIERPNITVPPVSQTNNAGDNVVFTATVVNNAPFAAEPLTYQWQHNNVDIPGETTTTLTLNSILCANQGNYKIIASNCGGSSTNSATLTILDPVITTHPVESTNSLPGDTVVFSVAAIGTAPLTYQWRLNGNNLAGKTDDTLTLENVQPSALTRYYSCRVTSPCGFAISSNALFIVQVPPTIAKQPVGATKTVGQSVTFSVIATASTPISYQWKTNGSPIAGATDSSYVIDPVTQDDAADYTVTLTALTNEVDSSTVTLNVNDDTTDPQITSAAPVNNSTVVSNLVLGVYNIRGTATDNARVTAVYYDLNNAGYQEVALTNNATSVNWSTNVTLTAGTNSLSLISVDYSSNTSAVKTLTFFYRTDSVLTIITNGEGGVVGKKSVYGQPADGGSLQVGRTYTLTASVGAGTNSIFTNWTDDIDAFLSSNAVYQFVMTSNLVLNANFIENPFTAAAGLYSGLFYESGGVAHHSAGYFSATVSSKRFVSGKINVGGNAIAFSGKTEVPGTFVKTISRAKVGKPDLTLTLALDFSNEQITGTIQEGVNWTSDLTADRLVWSTYLNPATAYASRYTMAIPGLADPAAGPVGYGYGVLNLGLNGKIVLSGYLSDNVRITQSAPISQNGDWPFYATAYPVIKLVTNGMVVTAVTEYQGSVLGWLNFSDNTPYSTDLAPQGTLSWIKTGWTNALYSGGFTNATAVVESSIYTAVAPAITNLVSQFVLTNGNLSTSISETVELQANNSFLILGLNTNNVKSTISTTTGTIGNSFLHPATDTTTAIRGVILQDQNVGRGYFMGDTEGGKMTIDP